MPTPKPESPRRRAILAIDGGGIRGAMSLEILAGLEAALRKASGRPDSCLADHFHLVAGTSVGGIIATLLALGRPVGDIVAFMERSNRKIFVRAPWHRRPWHKYRREALEEEIKELVGGEAEELGTTKLKTLLLLVMRNQTTDSPWLISNNPDALYNSRARDDCNLSVPLWQLVRASAAAPSYFSPQEVTFGIKKPYKFQFVDGAMTGFNNPAFKAFQYATTEPYGLSWETGEDRLTIVSVGTGIYRRQNPALRENDLHWGYLAATVPTDLIGASDREQDVLCRTFGRCRLGGKIDSEIEDLLEARTGLEPRLFNYYRLNVAFSLRKDDPDGLQALGLDVTESELEQLLAIDAIDSMSRLREIGRRVRERTDWSGICTDVIPQL